MAVQRSLRRRWAARVCGAYLAVVAVAAGVLWEAGDDSAAGTVLRYGPRWLLAVPAGALLVAAAGLRAWLGGALAAAAVVVTLWLVAGLRFSPLAERMDDPAERLRVMTLNCDAKAADTDRFAALVRELAPDVVALQDPGRAGRLANFPDGWSTATSTGGAQVISRYPVTAAGALHDPAFGGNDRGAAGFRVASPWGELLVVNVHLPTPRNGLEAALHLAANAPDKVAADARLRSGASEMVRAFAGPARENVFVLGDFNMPPEAPAFRRDWGGVSNAFDRAGTGFGWTMFTRHSAVRIDHVLYGPGWDCRACWVGPDVGSAHRPVVADFAPAGGP